MFSKLDTFSFVGIQELGLYKAQTKLPFNAFGTMAMAREVRITSLDSLSLSMIIFYLVFFSFLLFISCAVE